MNIIPSQKPLISVLMPVYNAEKYLQEAVDSILNQTFTDFEFLITDDGSIDNSLKILRKYAQQDPRIILITQANMGYTKSLNNMLRKAKGKYIARMDADDIALPKRFALQVNFLENNPDYVAVGSRVLLIDPEGLPIMPFSQQTHHEEIDRGHLAGKGGMIVHPAVMIRREALIEINGYRQELEPAEDLDLFLRLAEVGRIANIPETLFQYRMHIKSIGHTRRLEQKSSNKKAVLEAHQRRGLPIPDSINIEAIEANEPSHSDIHRKWAWWALKGKNIQTAKKQALLALESNPLTLDNWKVLFCTLRGY